MIATIFPFVSFLLFFMPAPAIWLGVKRGVVRGVLSTAIVSIVMGLIGGWIFTALYLLIVVPMVVITTTLIKDEKENWKIILINILALALIGIIFYLNFTYIMKIDVIGEVSNTIDMIAKDLVEVVKTSGMSDSMLKEIDIKRLVELVKISLPATIVVSGISMVFLSYIHSLNMLKKDRHKISQKFRFIDIRMPIKSLVPILIGAVLLMIAYYLNWNYFELFFINTISVVGFLFMVSGIFTADYYFINKIPKFLRILIPTLVIAFFGGSYFYMIVGLLDTFVNFRKRFVRVENEKI
ncbi:MAG: DUF2232 domain-containing protein [Lagierella massiliensis]|nr:DUF2232 domain-containing protein [Lagierella massiliensis]